MNMDWNWFFSSFSQSAAALLGIIGAFIISKLIGIDEKTNILSSDFEDLKIAYKKLKNSFSIREYSWINGILVTFNNQLIKDIENEKYDGLSEKEILEGLYKQDNRLYKDDNSIINAFRKLYNKHKQQVGNQYQFGVISTNSLSQQTLPQPSEETNNRVRNERDLINRHIIDSNELIEKFNKNLNSLENFSSSLTTIKIIIWILIISFPCTVIYPLHFLPIDAEQGLILTYNIIFIMKSFFTLSNMLLLMFFIAVEGIFIYFLNLVNHIKSELSNLKQNHTEEYTRINSYCEYYRKQ